ncbi:ABC-2 family transporter protein [Clostridium tertium]|uniref:ABC-2 family transporter protein n=1 Tax=Clostridium tertium TaxID=1559 RepID=A0A6N3GUP0_9CLOT
MLNILANERLKLKRNKLLLVCTLIALIIPTLMILVDIKDKNSITAVMSGIEWLQRLVLPIQVIVYPVLSGFIITFLIQKEYTERTIINTLTAPTNRIKFLLCKYIIWTLWFLVITSGFLLITYAGYISLFGLKEFQSSINVITELCLKTGLLNLLSMSPLLIVCILQRNIFYPSLLFSCFVSGIGFAGLYWPENIRNLIPWSAVTSISLLDTQKLLPYISILICYFLGIIISSIYFKKQNL